jgi:pimeloyl-ACP methyl ester carboxylesterase
VDAVGDRYQFVRAAEECQVRAAQTQCILDGIVVLFAFEEFPEVLVHLTPVVGQYGRLPGGGDESCRLGKVATASACLDEAALVPLSVLNESDGMTTLLLVHGGLWEDMDADQFWTRPGIAAGLRDRGFRVLAPDRLPRPTSWASDVDHILAALPDEPMVLVGDSNGCSVAALLTLHRPESVRALLLAWPATAGDARVDAWTRERMRDAGASVATVDALLAGGLLRGVSDVDLAGLPVLVGVLPSVPDNPFHQRRTVDSPCPFLGDGWLG